jgi:hypothetical protein
MGAILQPSFPNLTRESVVLWTALRLCSHFLRMAFGIRDSSAAVGRTQCDHTVIVWRKRLDFASAKSIAMEMAKTRRPNRATRTSSCWLTVTRSANTAIPETSHKRTSVLESLPVCPSLPLIYGVHRSPQKSSLQRGAFYTSCI